MTQKARSVLLACGTAIALLALGFTAGFYFSTPIRDGISRIQAARALEAEREERTERYLGKPAPAAASLRLGGGAWSLADERGRAVLLFFWAADCPHCRRLVPKVRELCGPYADRTDFNCIAVSLDREEKTLREYLAEQGMDWSVVFEPGAQWGNPVSEAFGIERIPSLWIIDAQGMVRGMDMEASQAEDALRALLDGGGGNAGAPGNSGATN